MLRDGCQDEPVLEVEVRGQLRSDAVQTERSGWGASDGVRPVLEAVVVHPFRARLADAAAGKSVVRAQGGQVPDACLVGRLPALSVTEQRGAVAVLCTPGAVQSAEQSFEAPALKAPRGPLAAGRLAETVVPEARPKQQVQAALGPRPEL